MEKPGGSGGFSWLLEIPPWGGVPLHSRPSFLGFENEDSLLLSHFPFLNEKTPWYDEEAGAGMREGRGKQEQACSFLRGPLLSLCPCS